jgi:hypothetical protein
MFSTKMFQDLSCMPVAMPGGGDLFFAPFDVLPVKYQRLPLPGFYDGRKVSPLR